MPFMDVSMEIFNSDGSVKEYMPVAERLPAFLEAYGPAQGYAVRTSTRLHPGFKAMSEVEGLPCLVIFEATLVNEKGKPIASGSSLRRVDNSSVDFRVWESGETAALQRLMARLGFGSDTLLADEQSDLSVRGVSFTDTDQPQGESEAPAQAVAPQVTQTQSPEPLEQSEQPEQPEQPKPQPPVEAKASGEVSVAPEVSDYMLRQIRHLANLRGIEPPQVASKAEAKAALKKLRSMPAQA